MFKQVFAKLFNKTSQQTNQSSVSFDQPQIYAIPTISSCFQSANNTPGLTQYYCNENQSQSSKLDSRHSSLDCKKYNDSNTRQIYIAPHCIRYTNSTLDDTIYRIDDDSLNEIAAEILDSDNMPPKLQIVYYDNNYFAINNSHLQIYKQLQLSGLITHVQADLISVEAIPLKLREHLLQTPSHLLELENLNNQLLEAEDEDLGENYNEIKCNSNSSGLTSSGHSANADSASDNETNNSFSKLVDETYEFGICDNCIDSDEEEEEEFDPKFSNKLEKSYYEDLNLEFNLMTTKKIISNEILKLRPPKIKTQIKRKLNTTSQKASFKKSSQILNENIEQISHVDTIVKLDNLLLSNIEPEIEENDKLIESNIETSSKLTKSNTKNQFKEKSNLDMKVVCENELESLLNNGICADK